jgi:hypothetical protein
MRRALLVCAFAGTLLAFAGCKRVDLDNTPIREFRSAEGRFTVQVPGSPKEESQTVLGMTMKVYTVEGHDGAFAVSYADVPIGDNESSWQISQRFDGARDGMLRNAGGKLTREYALTLQGKYRGRGIDADVPAKNGKLRARVYIVGKRFYQLLVVGTKERVESANATRFLDSLTVTP